MSTEHKETIVQLRVQWVKLFCRKPLFYRKNLAEQSSGLAQFIFSSFFIYCLSCQLIITVLRLPLGQVEIDEKLINFSDPSFYCMLSPGASWMQLLFSFTIFSSLLSWSLNVLIDRNSYFINCF